MSRKFILYNNNNNVHNKGPITRTLNKIIFFYFTSTFQNFETDFPKRKKKLKKLI